MRAERLLRLILILSDGRRRTAARLADLLEVSERTVYRDLVALQEIGAPVQATRGPEGGIELAPSWRRVPTLPLSSAEVAGLAALSVPDAREAVDAPLGEAVAKVLAGLSTTQRAHAQAARQRLLITPSSWWSEASSGGCLDVVLGAVWDDRRVALRYVDAEGRESAREADALAVVVQGERWYLVADTLRGRRTFRGDRIRAVEVRPERFERPELDLPSFWAEHVRVFTRTRPTFPVTLRLTPAGQERLARIRPAAESAGWPDGEVTVDFHREDIAVGQLAALGDEVRVVGPQAFRDRLAHLVGSWLR